MTVPEIVIAMALLGVVGLGVASLMETMAKMQASAMLRQTLTSLKFQIEANIKSDAAWDHTVSDSANNIDPDPGQADITCLKKKALCVANTSPGYQFNMRDSTNALFFEQSVATKGFTQRGEPCNTFNATTPDPRCPIRYTIVAQLSCRSAAASCFNPTIKVIATPTIPSGLWSKLGSINPENYKVEVTRGVGTRFDPILIVERLNKTGAVAGTASAGVGACADDWTDPPALRRRQLNHIEVDPANNVELHIDSGTGLPDRGIVFAGPATYTCRATVPGFKVGSHFLRMVDAAGTGFPTGSIPFSPPAISLISYPTLSNAVLETTFTIATSTVLFLEQRCQNVGAMGSTPIEFQKGFAVPSTGAYITSVFTTLSCYRTD